MKLYAIKDHEDRVTVVAAKDKRQAGSTFKAWYGADFDVIVPVPAVPDVPSVLTPRGFLDSMAVWTSHDTIAQYDRSRARGTA